MTGPACLLCVWGCLFAFIADARAQAPAHAEPSVQAVVEMALRAAHPTAPGRAEQVGRRARLAGLVPQLRLAGRRGLQQDLSSTSTLSDDGRLNASLGDDLSLEASLTFQLDRLVFAPEQVRLLAVERWLAADRRKLVEDVVRLFFRRARLLLERRGAAQADPALDADIAELDALLDAYTNGAFGEALAKRPAQAALTVSRQAPAPAAAPAPEVASPAPGRAAASAAPLPAPSVPR